MSSRLNQADLWLIEEITNELQKEFNISIERAKDCIRNSNLLPMLYSNPYFVHHEDPISWVRIIASQNKLKKLVV